MLLSVCDYTRRDIASAIKEVLDAVNEVSKKHQGDPRMREHKKVGITDLSILTNHWNCATFSCV